jgi:protein-tyrosine kinase
MSKIEEALQKAKKTRVEKGPVDSHQEIETPQYKLVTAFHQTDPELLEMNRIVTLTGQAPEVKEQYRMLRTQILQKTEENGDNCLMVTSAVDGEGKTTTAINLAVTIAREVQQNVLLVDADLRSPSIDKVLGLESKKGLAQYLSDNMPLQELFIRTGLEKLTVLPAGGALQNSSEILRSSKMQELIREVKKRYRDRYIIFDTPPLLSTADPSVLAQYMDGIVLVVGAEKTSRSDVQEALALLEGRNILGVVMNKSSGAPRTYGYET